MFLLQVQCHSVKEDGFGLSSKKGRRKLGIEHLQRVIDRCKSVERLGLDPFLVEVDDLVAVIREYFPDWESLEELSLDSKAINCLASVVKLQGDWVRHRSTSLYTDPFLVEEKLHRLSAECLAQIFLDVWHPIVEMEQVSVEGLAAALKYWRGLLPLEERWIKTDLLMAEPGSATREELIMQNIMGEEAFTEELERLWRELKRRVGRNGKLPYWDFVGSETFEETVQRAYMTSFLVTYGYATLEVHPLEEEVFVRPFDGPRSLLGKKRVVSIPVSVSLEEWRLWHENRHE